MTAPTNADDVAHVEQVVAKRPEPSWQAGQGQPPHVPLYRACA